MRDRRDQEKEKDPHFCATEEMPSLFYQGEARSACPFCDVLSVELAPNAKCQAIAGRWQSCLL